MKEIWFAGGCFWGTELLMSAIPGVVSTEVGYANGDPSVTPTYSIVCRRTTEYRETVHVTYDETEVSLDYLVYVFYASIDPTLKDRQGNDYGPQYQSGIFWKDPASEAVVRRISFVEARRYRPFHVLLLPLSTFTRAEDEHQRYLEKNPHGYCHVDRSLIEQVGGRVFDPARYKRPSDQEIREMLTDEQFRVSQCSSTETPFDNEYDREFGTGIYVDRVTGEPLFLSKDKFDSHCGWPAFSRPIDPCAVVTRDDHLLPITRIEVRSRVGDSHLGHLFYGDPHSPTSARYCMNSASLRFVPRDDMEKEGYGDLVPLVERSFPEFAGGVRACRHDLESFASCKRLGLFRELGAYSVASKFGLHERVVDVHDAVADDICELADGFPFEIGGEPRSASVVGNGNRHHDIGLRPIFLIGF